MNIEIIEDVKKMFKCNSKQEAITRFSEMKNKLENKYPSVICNTERKLGELLRFYDYPFKIRNSLKSIESNSRHAFRKMNGYVKCHDEIGEIFNNRYHL